MYCPECGAKVRKDEDICPECGADLWADETSGPTEQELLRMEAWVTKRKVQHRLLSLLGFLLGVMIFFGSILFAAQKLVGSDKVSKIYKKLGISTEEVVSEETVSVENAAGAVLEDQQAENTDVHENETSTAAAKQKVKKG
ncbi:MAG: zinc ribbon domain-containing protein [Bacillota bacterium]|nr:zinc ribbon domain-containing protein [Bacillota bacterium]